MNNKLPNYLNKCVTCSNNIHDHKLEMYITSN